MAESCARTTVMPKAMDQVTPKQRRKIGHSNTEWGLMRIRRKHMQRKWRPHVVKKSSDSFWMLYAMML